ncbi:hypothetical protein BZA77DRAFT_313475 [Pyronema omphalodes]|nr:hypothetical protein BZA77DRAFT_313475 [Pyronema omphalodes]
MESAASTVPATAATAMSENVTAALVLNSVPQTCSITTAINYWAPSITETYARINTYGAPTLLYIGAPPPFTIASRRKFFPAVQKLLTEVYALCFKLAAECSVKVDVRVVLLDDNDSADDNAFGPVLRTEQLADMQLWDALLVTRNDQGYQNQGQFLGATMSPNLRVYYVSPGTLEKEEDIIDIPQAEGELEEHKIVAVGGTFDHLHLGHKLLLTCTAFMAASPCYPTTRLIIGLTGPEMLKDKKHAEQMEAYQYRSTRVLEFLRGIVDITPFDSRGPLETSEVDGVTICNFTEYDRGDDSKKVIVEISELSDPFGPTITEEGVTALVVTKETESGGAAVNKRREDKGWNILEVGVVDLLMDGEEKLSSTKLRRMAGERELE